MPCSPGKPYYHGKILKPTLLRKDWDDYHAPFIQIHPLTKSGYGPTNGPMGGPTDGQSLLLRCMDASKNRETESIFQTGASS